MRRLRSIREMRHREILQRRSLSYTPTETSTRPSTKTAHRKELLATRNRIRRDRSLKDAVGISFLPYDVYEYKSRPVVVCHVIESLGLGGAQTMMMELVKALDRYFGEFCKNLFVGISKSGSQSYNQELYSSYGIDVQQCERSQIAAFCESHGVDIVVQHRISLSTDLKQVLPHRVKYVLVNHTWNKLNAIRLFGACDAYISVCDFLHSHSPYRIPQRNSIAATILNGVENDYISRLPSLPLEGTLKTGRCHRLIHTKFNRSSLRWLASLPIPGLHHHLIGQDKQSESICAESNVLTYHGPIYDLAKKMSIIKSLDVYFYETFSSEGASIAVLESLACGVPVLCRDEGGNSELVKNGINGFIVSGRDEFQQRLVELSDHQRLRELKKSTLGDFNRRLHVKYTACKYVQLFEKLVGEL